MNFGNDLLLIETLRLSVPMKIQEYLEHGGVGWDDIQRVSVQLEITETAEGFKTVKSVGRGHATVLGEKSDVLMFGGGKRGEAANAFNVLTDSLAILAFAWGGVIFSGLHFEAPEEYQLIDRTGAA